MLLLLLLQLLVQLYGWHQLPETCCCCCSCPLQLQEGGHAGAVYNCTADRLQMLLHSPHGVSSALGHHTAAAAASNQARCCILQHTQKLLLLLWASMLPNLLASHHQQTCIEA